MSAVEVRRTYLRLESPRQLVPAHSHDAGLRLDRLEPSGVALYRRLYEGVGGPYHWFERRGWDDAILRAHLARAVIEVQVLSHCGSVAGYFELERHDDASVEIVYFGLLPVFHGRGFGKHLLTLAVERAFASGASRVWLHTCSLDAAAALPNYERRGFRAYRWETDTIELPASA